MAQALDYSAGRPSGGAVKAAGYDGVVRYIGFDPTVRGKCVTKAEYEDHKANGVQVAFVYEDDVGTSLQGRGRGQDDARAVLRWAEAIGAPVHACYFAVDFDAQPAVYPAMDDYFRGAADILGIERVGGYGGYYVVKHLFDTGLITYGWQTVAWSRGLRESRAHLYQRLGAVTVGGVACDVNDILQASYGQAPGPTTEDDMTPEQDALIRDIHEQLCGGGARVPDQYPGWDALDGTGRKLTAVDLLREAQREGNMRLTSRVPGSTYKDTVLGYAANADAAGYELVKRVAELAGKVDGLTSALAQLSKAGGTVDLAAVTKAAHDGAASAVTSPWIPAMVTLNGNITPVARVTQTPAQPAAGSTPTTPGATP